jgi:DNA repair protein RadC
VEYELGTVKVQAELREEQNQKIETFHDVTQKYSELGEKQKEHVYAVFLGNNNEEIGDKLIGLGSRDSAPLDLQDVARTAVLVNAGAVILIHNHPSNRAEATEKDRETTRNLYQALQHLNIELLDHVIITKTGSYSMRRNQEGPF